MQTLIFGDERMGGIAMQRIENVVIAGIIGRCLRSAPWARRPRLQLRILTKPIQCSGTPGDIWVAPDVF
jgi:hypothetical protein